MARAVFLALTMTGGLSAQSTRLSAADNATKNLNEVTRELIHTVSALQKDLDEAVRHQDAGDRLPTGRRIEGADADLTEGEADIIQNSVRKLVAFRMLAARGGSYQPAAAADIDRIQQLIAESHRRVEASSAVLRRLLVVSISEINRDADAQVKLRHQRLLKARGDAQEAAKTAFLALPINLPESDSPEESRQKAWDLHVANRPVSPKPVSAAHEETFEPFQIERLRRFTLVREASLRIALTDSGMEDAQGRHVFYQEEWIQRGPAVVWKRWRVGVEAATGRHVLIKRYPPLEFAGAIDRYYDSGNHRLWSLEPADDSTEPSRGEVETAIGEVQRSRDEIRAAIQDFRGAIHEALLRDDRMREEAGEVLLDGGLSPRVRETLFAIRGHLADVESVLKLEQRVRTAIARGDERVRTLEPLVAWANREDWAVSTNPAADVWEQLFDQSDREIDLLRSTETQALAALPPDSAAGEDKFPPLEKNLVIRLRSVPHRSYMQSDGRIRFLQEVWRRETRIQGSSEVRRTVTLMLIDPKTGAQTRAASNTKYYPIGPDGLLEEVYEEYASEELIVSGVSYK